MSGHFQWSALAPYLMYTSWKSFNEFQNYVTSCIPSAWQAKLKLAKLSLFYLTSTLELKQSLTIQTSRIPQTWSGHTLARILLCIRFEFKTIPNLNFGGHSHYFAYRPYPVPKLEKCVNLFSFQPFPQPGTSHTLT